MELRGLRGIGHAREVRQEYHHGGPQMGAHYPKQSQAQPFGNYNKGQVSAAVPERARIQAQPQGTSAKGSSTSWSWPILRGYD